MSAIHVNPDDAQYLLGELPQCLALWPGVCVAMRYAAQNHTLRLISPAMLG